MAGLLVLLGPLIALVLVIVLVSIVTPVDYVRLGSAARAATRGLGRHRPPWLRVLAAVLALLGSKDIDALRSTHVRRFRLQDMSGVWVNCGCGGHRSGLRWFG